MLISGPEMERAYFQNICCEYGGLYGMVVSCSIRTSPGNSACNRKTISLCRYIAAQLGATTGFTERFDFMWELPGRPLHIHREDYDTRLPDVDTVSRHSLYICKTSRSVSMANSKKTSSYGCHIEIIQQLRDTIPSLAESQVVFDSLAPSVRATRSRLGRSYQVGGTSRNLLGCFAQILRGQLGTDDCSKTYWIFWDWSEIAAVVHGASRDITIHSLTSTSPSNLMSSHVILVHNPASAVFLVSTLLLGPYRYTWLS